MAAASSYKLTYFDIRGLAEGARLVLTAAGVAFEDDRIPFSKNADGTFHRGDWEQRKTSTPYGQVPVLTIDGKVQLAQSAAICRFVARRHGLIPSDDIEAALVDAGYEHLQDLRKAFFTARGDEAKLADYWSKTFPEHVEKLNRNVKGNLWFGGDKMSYLDVLIYYTFFVLDTENKAAVETALKANPKIQAISEAVQKDAKIAAYLAKRKQTPM